MEKTSIKTHTTTKGKTGFTSAELEEKSVSYTHLDVYKRQPTIRAEKS